MNFVLYLLAVTFSSALMAKEINPLNIVNFSEKSTGLIESDYNQEMQIAYLSKRIAIQEKSYEDKFAFLENELKKTKDRLVEKSMNQEAIEEQMIKKYSAEAVYFKRELVYKTKILLDYQRQMEKLKPSEDLKNIIKLNTQLTAELRKSEDQIAIMQLQQPVGIQGVNSGVRSPASVSKSK